MRVKTNRWAGGAAVLCCCLVLLGGAPVPGHAAESSLAEARKLMQAGRAADAYSLLAPHEDRLAGDINYDYLLGIAALDSGKADRATLAFERVLAVNPDFAGARIDMGRAYFHLGDMTRARVEFETVLSQNPPELARGTINRYLQLIDKAEQAKRTAISAYIEAGLGRDSNVNNSTSEAQINVPALGNILFTLDPTNVKRRDNYGFVGVGADIAHQIGDGYALLAGAEARHRQNRSEDRFDSRTVAGRVGVAWSNDTNVIRFMTTVDQYDLDHAHNRTGAGLSTDWRHAWTSVMLTNAFINFNTFRFNTTELSVNDFDQHLIGFGVLRLYDEGRSAVSATLLAGREDDKNMRADGNKMFHGVRLGGQINFMEKVDFFMTAGLQRGTYDRENTAFRDTRADDQHDLAAGIIWRLADGWSLRPQVLRTRNDSNISMYSYKRTDLSVTLRRDFR